MLNLENTQYYYRQHDFDNNTKLDGLEIYKALTDIVPYNSEELEKISDPEERRRRQEKYYSGWPRLNKKCYQEHPLYHVKRLIINK